MDFPDRSGRSVLQKHNTKNQSLAALFEHVSPTAHDFPAGCHAGAAQDQGKSPMYGLSSARGVG
jgi:hypothetical protein